MNNYSFSGISSPAWQQGRRRSQWAYSSLCLQWSCEFSSCHFNTHTYTQCPSNRSFVHFLRQPKNVRLALNATLRELLRPCRCLCCQNTPGMPNVLNKVARLQREQVVHSGLQVSPPLAVVQKTKLSAQRCIFCSHGTHCCPVLFTINKFTRFPQLKPSEAQSNFILNQTHRDETKSESSWNSAFAFENTGSLRLIFQ